MSKGGRDIAMRISWNDLHVLLVAEGVSWSPDVADDMAARIRPLWRNALEDFKESGFLADYDDYDDEDYEDELEEDFEEEGAEYDG